MVTWYTATYLVHVSTYHVCKCNYWKRQAKTPSCTPCSLEHKILAISCPKHECVGGCLVISILGASRAPSCLFVLRTDSHRKSTLGTSNVAAATTSLKTSSLLENTENRMDKRKERMQKGACRYQKLMHTWVL